MRRNPPVLFAFALSVLALISFAPGAHAADAYFSEDFSSGTQNPNLEPYTPYFAVSDGAIHRTAPEAFDDRRYLRSVLSDYNRRDFTFEVTFTCKDDIIWFGIGPADRNSAYHEPQKSVVFWVYPTSINGAVGFNTTFGSLQIDRVYSDGPHRVRIEKIGKRITFELDEKFNGVFQRDIFTSLMDINEVMPSLTDSNSFLFFGSVSSANYFDDVVIRDPGVPPPDCNSNGAPDTSDIAGGTSLDANKDGVPDECQVVERYFTDDFEGIVENPSLEGYGSFFYVADGVLRRTGANANDDRHYLRTVAADYNKKDFVFEVTFTTKDDIVFIGLGEAVGNSAYHEPSNSLNFRAHPLKYNGNVGLVSADGEIDIGKLKTAGPHRARIEKKGQKITFSIDDVYDGTFKADITHTYANLSTSGSFLTDRSSHLFLGSLSAVETYDDLSIQETVVSGPDCNQNLIADADDIQSGTSRDLNGDGVPDECQSMQGKLELSGEVGTGRVKVIVTSDVTIKGGEIGLSYDPKVLLPLEIRRGTDLPVEAEIQQNLSPQISCADLPNVSAGITVGWINSSTGSLLTPAGRHELLEIVFAPSFTQFKDGCFPVQFESCLGVPTAPVRNILTDADGKSLLVGTTNGEACVKGRPAFRRGDANGDGNFDISDPITILGCLFIGTDCPACADASDANDDGLVNISDPLYLLNWRFRTGSQPPPPFPECGADVTTDGLEGCESFPGC